MKKFLILLLCLSILQLSLINADTNNDLRLRITIINNSMNIKLYAPLTVFGITQLGEVYSSTESLPVNFYCNPFNNTIIDLPANVSYSNHTEIINPVGNYSLNYILDRVVFSGILNSSGGTNSSVSETILSDIIKKLNQSLDDYELCLTDKATLFGNYRGMAETLALKNNSYNDYVRCSSDLIQCNNEKATAKSESDSVKQTQEANKNEKFTWAVGGAILAVVGTLFFTGRIGGPKSKRPEEIYNRGQSG